MILTLLGRRIAAWIACWAILLATLYPLLSHARMAAGRTGFQVIAEICTAAGLAVANVEKSHFPHSSPGQKELHFKDCLICLAQGGLPGLLPTINRIIPVAAGRALRPPLFTGTWHSPRPWTAAQSRAPPFAS
jgi:hypothetical protein